MNGPRCTGLAIPARLVCDDDDLLVMRCVCCGWYGGDRLIELHQRLRTPPEPRYNEMPGERISRK